MGETIEGLFREYYTSLVALVKKNAVCKSMAEDIVQEAFCEAVDQYGDELLHENPEAWLKKTIGFKMLNLQRRSYLRSEVELDEWKDNVGELEAQFGEAELSLLVEKVLEPHDRALFHMHYMEGYSVKELASLEGITEGNMKVRLHRMRKKLRKAVEEQR